MQSDNPLSRTKAALRPVVFVYLGVMILTWAGNWPLMKLALGQAPPLVFVLLRLIGSLALIAPALVAARQPLLPVRGERLSLFWVGELQVAGFLICSIIPVAAIVLTDATGGAVRWSPELVAILAYNCIVTTALGYFLWGKVLSMMPPATAGQVLTLTPIGGFVLSTLILGGTVTADVVLSIVLIMGGIFITMRR
jgi:drug/metabolite transporter (DMT)-like permease